MYARLFFQITTKKKPIGVKSHDLDDKLKPQQCGIIWLLNFSPKSLSPIRPNAVILLIDKSTEMKMSFFSEIKKKI